MRIYWHLEAMFSQLRLLINWSKFCPERASQPGEHWMSHWAQVTCSLLLCSVISPAVTPILHILCTSNDGLGFFHFLDISISVSHTDCWIWVSAVTNPCHTVSVWSFQTVLSDPSALPFSSVWNRQVSASRSLGSTDRVHMWWLFSGNYDLQSLDCT